MQNFIMFNPHDESSEEWAKATSVPIPDLRF